MHSENIAKYFTKVLLHCYSFSVLYEINVADNDVDSRYGTKSGNTTISAHAFEFS